MIEQIKVWNQKTKSFFESILFMAILVGLTFLCYCLKWITVAYFALAIIIFVLLLLDCKYIAVIPLFYLYYASRATFESWPIGTVKYYILLAILAIDTIFFIYRVIQKRKEYIPRIKKDWLFYSLLGILVALFLSLINTESIKYTFLGIGFFAFVLLVYLLTKIDLDKDEKTKNYIVLSIIFVGLLVSSEIAYGILKCVFSGRQIRDIITNKEYSMIGWINVNHAAAIINICILLSVYYFIVNNKIHVRLLIVFAVLYELAISLLTVSRGGYLALFLLFPISILIYFIYNKKIYHNSIKMDSIYLIQLFLSLIIVLIVFYKLNILSYVIEYLEGNRFRPSGRNKVYEAAIARFKLHPIVGNGIYTAKLYTKNYNYHSYIFEMLGCCGIIGLLSFVVYLVISIYYCMKKNLYSIFVLLVIMYFLIHGLLDTIYFNPVIWPILAVLQGMLDNKELPFIKKKNDSLCEMNLEEQNG